MRNPIRAYIERLVQREMERHIEALTNTVMDNNAFITEQLVDMGVIEVADGELRKVER